MITESKHYHEQWFFLAFMPGKIEVLSGGQYIREKTVGGKEENIL